MTTRIIDRVGLIALLAGIVGEQVVTLVAETEPKLNKKHRVTKEPNPYEGRVTKRAVVECTLNANYAARVNAQRIAEGKVADFESQERKYGERIGDSPLVQHGEKMFVTGIREGGDSMFLLDGEPGKVTKDELEPYMSPDTPSKSQGLDREVQYLNYNLDSIKAVKIGEEVYEVA